MAVDPVVLVDRPAPHVARLRINRPAKRNAIDHDVRQGLLDALPVLLGDADVRALVFGGVDGVFSAGGDVASMAGLDESGARARMRHVHALCTLVAGIGLPVVTAMEGFSAGAAVGLALLGDHIVAGPGTKILFPFLRLGLTPDWGQVLTLPRRVGVAQARRIFTSGAPVGGEEAFHIGLVDALVGDADVMASAIGKAGELAALPREAFGRMKLRLQDVSASLADELVREESDQAGCLLSDDFKEGLAAFHERRAPNFIERDEDDRRRGR